MKQVRFVCQDMLSEKYMTQCASYTAGHIWSISRCSEDEWESAVVTRGLPILSPYFKLFRGTPTDPASLALLSSRNSFTKFKELKLIPLNVRLLSQQHTVLKSYFNQAS